MAAANFLNMNASNVFVVKQKFVTLYQNDLHEFLTEKFKDSKGLGKYDGETDYDTRNYPSVYLGAFEKTFERSRARIEVVVKSVLRQGYYQGFNLDWEVDFYVTTKNTQEFLFFETIEDLEEENLVPYGAADLQRTAAGWARGRARSLESAYKSVADAYRVLGRASNGEVMLQKVVKEGGFNV